MTTAVFTVFLLPTLREYRLQLNLLRLAVAKGLTSSYLAQTPLVGSEEEWVHIVERGFYYSSSMSLLQVFTSPLNI